MSRRLDERRAEHQRYKEDVKERGQAVLPVRDVPRHDDEPVRRRRDRRACAVIWNSRPRRPGRGTSPAGSGGSTTRRPTPGRRASPRGPTGTSTSSSTSCGSSSGRSRSILGTVVIPTMLLMLLLALPFIDRAARAAAAAPAGGGGRGDPDGDLDGRAHLQGRRCEGVAGEREPGARRRRGPRTQGFAGNEEAVAGREHLRRGGCLNCHTYLGAGSSNLGAPDLSEIGASSNRGVEGFRATTSPTRRSSATASMPKYAGPRRGEAAQRSARFLERLQGPADDAGLPRDHGRLRGALCRAPGRGAGRGRLRGRRLRLRCGRRGARDRALRRPAAAAGRGARALRRAGRRRRHGLRPARLLVAVRERLGARSTATWSARARWRRSARSRPAARRTWSTAPPASR